MRASLSLLGLVLTTVAVCKEAPRVRIPNQTPARDDETQRGTGVTNKYIVELEPAAVVGSVARELGPKPFTNGTFYKAFDCSDIFNGLTIETDSHNADTLRRLDGVVNVWPMKTVSLDPMIKKNPVKPRYVKRQTAHNYSMHQWTGVDKLHAAGIRGKGATVAIIDTGIDYTHEALGGCFGPGCKVAGGFDLVGSTWNAHDQKHHPKQPDADPRDYYGHGTHVAGIIAAENEWLTGVAPDAELLIYKVFADVPYDTDEQTIIDAFCDAYSAGADVISASIGRPDGFVDNPWALVASRIVEKGVVVTISAGNEGYEGPFYSSSGSDGHDVLSVSAINVTGNPNISTSDPRALPMACPFTSWGPTNEILMKPSIGAPGYEVVSTVLNQSYDELSGTSMAAPYIAGVAALFIGEHGGREFYGPGFAAMLGKRIMSSGRSVAWNAAATILNHTAPPWQVGTGLVDAWKVVQYDTQVTFEPFALLDTELFRPNWTAEIANFGNRSVTYTFQVEPQSGINIYDADYGVASLFDLEPVKIVPSVNLPSTLTVKPRTSQQVDFTFYMPEGINDDLLPLYSGKIWIIGSNGERLCIPYGGAAYDTEKAFDTMFNSEPYLSQFSNEQKNTWSFNVQQDAFDFAQLSTSLSYPCFDLRWDIYDKYYSESQWEYPPQIGKNGYVGSATSMRDAEQYWFFDPTTMDKNDTVSFPMKRVTRGYQSFWWFGKLANGTQIAPGNYTMRFAALRPYGNPDFADHWDVMGGNTAGADLPMFQILPMNSTSGTNGTRTATKMKMLKHS